MLLDLKLSIFLSFMKTYFLLKNIMTNFIHLHLNKVVKLTLLCYQKRGSLPTLVMMFRVMQSFIHIVLTKQEADLGVYQKLLHIDPYGQFFGVSCMLLDQWGKDFVTNNCATIIIGVYRHQTNQKFPSLQ